MNKFIMFFGLAFVFSFLSLADQAFDPNLLTKNKGTWTSKKEEFLDEEFVDYAYKGVVVFRVLERFAPLIDRKIIQAKEEKATLVMGYTKIGFFSSAQSIHYTFNLRVINYTRVDPKNIILRKKIGLDLKTQLYPKKRYYLQLSNDENRFEISRNLYDYFRSIMTTARLKGMLLDLNLSLISQKNHAPEKCVILVPKELSDETLCVACKAAGKNIMLEPCRHVCLCEECSQKIDNKCPICRGIITKKTKVFW